MERYRSGVPSGKWDMVLDQEHCGVEKHLCKIAELLDPDWELKLVPAMEIKAIELRDIQEKYAREPKHQRYIVWLQIWLLCYNVTHCLGGKYYVYGRTSMGERLHMEDLSKYVEILAANSVLMR